MSLPQENFDRAVRSGQDTLKTVSGGSYLELGRESKQRLQTMLWDLEAIGAAIRLELMNRESEHPVDFG